MQTYAEALGQIVWLLSQSKVHREMQVKDLEWSFIPALLNQQFRVFRFGPLPGLDATKLAPAGLDKAAIEKMPLGVAIWAKLSAAAEAKLDAGEHLSASEWKSGDRVWLVELISPFATPENKLSHAMLLDLIGGPFRQTAFSLHRTDSQTGRKEKVVMRSHLQNEKASGENQPASGPAKSPAA